MKATLFMAHGTDIVGLVSLFLQSMFYEVNVKLNDVMVSSTNIIYAYHAYIETLLSYDPDAKQSRLTR